MLTSLLISFAGSIISFILNLLPDSTGFPSSVDDSMQFIGSYVGIIDPLVPIATLATVLGILFTLEITIFGFRAFRWFFSHVPFVGGRA